MGLFLKALDAHKDCGAGDVCMGGSRNECGGKSNSVLVAFELVAENANPHLHKQSSAFYHAFSPGRMLEDKALDTGFDNWGVPAFLTSDKLRCVCVCVVCCCVSLLFVLLLLCVCRASLPHQRQPQHRGGVRAGGADQRRPLVQLRQSCGGNTGPG